MTGSAGRGKPVFVAVKPQACDRLSICSHYKTISRGVDDAHDPKILGILKKVRPDAEKVTYSRCTVLPQRVFWRDATNLSNRPTRVPASNEATRHAPPSLHQQIHRSFHGRRSEAPASTKRRRREPVAECRRGEANPSVHSAAGPAGGALVYLTCSESKASAEWPPAGDGGQSPGAPGAGVEARTALLPANELRGKSGFDFGFVPE